MSTGVLPGGEITGTRWSGPVLIQVILVLMEYINLKPRRGEPDKGYEDEGLNTKL
ncbi:hypothetical protein Stok01_00975 [Sulfurisphaera tokodaii]